MADLAGEGYPIPKGHSEPLSCADDSWFSAVWVGSAAAIVGVVAQACNEKEYVMILWYMNSDYTFIWNKLKKN